MPDVVTIILIIFSAFVCCLCSAEVLSDDAPKSLLFVWVVPLALLSWFIYAANLPLEIDDVTYYRVETMKLADGTTVQIINCDREIMNCLKLVPYVLPEDEQVVRTKYKKMYGGIYFTDSPKIVWSHVKHETAK